MNLLSDVITYVRRIIKSPSNASISDSLIIDYINRFWINDVDARLQLFDFKTKFQFQTTPGVDKYNMPLYTVQSGDSISPSIATYPVYQGFVGTAWVNGVAVNFETQKNLFYNYWPNVSQYQQVVAIGDGTVGPYTINLQNFVNNTTPINPPVNAILRGHVDITGIISTNDNVDPPLSNDADFAEILGEIPTTSIDSAFYITTTSTEGSNIVVADSGIFLDTNTNCGLLMVPGSAPYGNSELTNGAYSETLNTINYLTGECVLNFNEAVPEGVNINVQYYYFQTGLPRSILYYNNTLTLRSCPDRQYLVELDAYLTPAAFFDNAQALPFGYMAEYIARGAARKILSDTGDAEQLAFYEPLFREQEMLVLKRSERQWTANRTHTIYSLGGRGMYGMYGMNGSGGTNY